MTKLKRLRHLAITGLAALGIVSAAIYAIVHFVEDINGLPEHMVTINSQGHAIDPTGNIFCKSYSRLCNGWHVPAWFIDYDELGQDGRESYHDYLTRMFMKLREHSAKKNNGKRKVMIFVHGGLNSQREGIRRADRLAEMMKNEPDPYYPIFINWDSSFFSAYYDYLLHVRQGEYYRWWAPRAWGLAPFYFLADTVRGIFQAPVLWFSELGKTEPEEWLQKNVSERISLPCWPPFMPLCRMGSRIEQDYPRAAMDLKNAYDLNSNGDVIAIWEGQDRQKFWPEQFVSNLTWVLTLPTKIVLAPLLDAYSESSLQMNLRRAHVLFHTDSEFTDKAGGAYSDHEGALAVFMSRLYQEYRADKNRDPRVEWDITLVGHSMGTIVLNEMIRGYGVVTAKDKNGKYVEEILPFNQIVYMAAACTIRDYEDSVFPYLKKNERAQFYHLTLHEEAEERERYEWSWLPYIDPLPRGSQLVWLDDFMANPLTYLDLSLGRFDNLMLTVHDTPNKIRRQISIKASGAGEAVKAPQNHVDFTQKFKFWKEECWKPNNQDLPACFNEKGHY